MITKELQDAFVEINTILNNLEVELVNKIPLDIRNFLKTNMSSTHKFNYDAKIPLIHQELKPETKGIIAFLYKEYICDENEKQEFIEKYSQYINNIEQQKLDFNAEELFKNNVKNYDIPKANMPTIKEKWYVRIINMLKSVFKEK